MKKEIKLIFNSCFGCRHCNDIHEKIGSGYEFNVTFYCTYEQPGKRIPNDKVHEIQNWCTLPAKTIIDHTRKNDLQRGRRKSSHEGYPWDCDCEACVRAQKRNLEESSKKIMKKKEKKTK